MKLTILKLLLICALTAVCAGGIDKCPVDGCGGGTGTTCTDGNITCSCPPGCGCAVKNPPGICECFCP